MRHKHTGTIGDPQVLREGSGEGREREERRERARESTKARERESEVNGTNIRLQSD